MRFCFLDSYYSDFGSKIHVPHFGDELSIYKTFAVHLGAHFQC